MKIQDNHSGLLRNLGPDSYVARLVTVPVELSWADINILSLSSVLHTLRT